MFDGIKILNLSVSARTLLKRQRLIFPLPVDEHTGELLPLTRRAVDHGLTFSLIPTKANRHKYRVELSGSLHRYSRAGRHNADDFTADEVAAAVEVLVRTHGIAAARSTLNNLEFGVNLVLPFPVVDLLQALICYRGIPFECHTDNKFPHYQATLQQYVVKVYDKGAQYNLPGHVVRFEIKVLKMRYLHRQGINIRTLADLTDPAHYPALGTLLIDTFRGILFDEPLITKTDVPGRDREFLIEARNPRYWQRPETDQTDYEKRRKQLQREETRFRALLSAHRPGRDWQSETASLLRHKWTDLTSTNGHVIRGTSAKECPELTRVSDEGITGNLSQINPLDVVLNWDNVPGQKEGSLLHRGTPVRRRPTATDLQADADLLTELEQGRKRYCKGSKENREQRAAHNLRNDESNPRNNLKRSINKVYRYPLLFDVSGTLRLTEQQRATLSRNA